MPVYPPMRSPSGQTVPPCISHLVVRQKLWFESGGDFVIGEGGFDLLNAIRATGSLSGGAKVVGWSYRHAWGYLRRAERVLGGSLTAARSGKGRNRGLMLTPLADRLMEAARHAGWCEAGAAGTRA